MTIIKILSAILAVYLFFFSFLKEEIIAALRLSDIDVESLNAELLMYYIFEVRFRLCQDSLFMLKNTRMNSFLFYSGSLSYFTILFYLIPFPLFYFIIIYPSLPLSAGLPNSIPYHCYSPDPLLSVVTTTN